MGDKLTKTAEVLFEKEAVAYVSKLFQEMSSWIKESPLSQRQLGFIVGFILFLRGFVACIIHILLLNLSMAFLDIITSILGALALSIEYKNPKCPRLIKTWIMNEMLFVYKPYGRPFIYICLGLLIIATGDYKNTLSTESLACGAFVTIAGMYSIIYTCFSSSKLQAMKEKKEQKLNDVMDAFNAADTNHDGKLSSAELVQLMHFLDSTLTSDEIELALVEMDGNHDEEVSVEELQKWYDRRDEEHLV